MRGHLDAQTLAAFREGLLPRRRAARASAHLAACQDCAAVERQLASLAGVLASTPAPAMPPEVTARISAALAAEATARSASQQAAAQPKSESAPVTLGPVISRGPAVPSAPATPSGSVAANGTGRAAGDTRTPRAGGNTAQGGRGARRTRSWLHGGGLRLAGGLAAVAVLAGGGVVIAQLTSGSAGETSAVSGPNATRSGASGSGAAHSASGLREPRAIPPGGFQVVASATDYQPATLSTQARALVTHYISPRMGTEAPAPSLPRGAFSSEKALTGCVRRVTGGIQPAVVDLAAYRGRPAAIIVAPAGHGHAGRVWVVAPGCTGAAGSVLATQPLPAAG